ncbi:hypothetical protein BDM02DRAFT_3207847 [Thelephora ganbajun]|uniref:Uncharacterized protein n=1 Tax=Thelephora ganbajun TaxID=370292 RepID=A0ACB6Z683_THEGA|nr:hypothetical protein BDM02DRAFT_3207847 [Thelephora ganbajun]
MYDEDMMEPGKVTEGLFRGLLLIAVYMYIFISKHVARGEKKMAQKGITEINQMGNVEPATICYVVLQMWVGISNMNEWSKTDYGVDLSMLYTALCHLLDFKRGKDPWVDKTLDWWNSQVVRGATTEAGASQDNEAPSTPKILDIEWRQRMAATS